MKRFTKVVENIESQKYFRVNAEIELRFKADNEGEAGYLADSELGSVESQTDFRIVDISEITEDEYQGGQKDVYLEESLNVSQDINLIRYWENKFGNRKPSFTEKMEFYHEMRKTGFEGTCILNTLKDKISFFNR